MTDANMNTAADASAAAAAPKAVAKPKTSTAVAERIVVKAAAMSPSVGPEVVTAIRGQVTDEEKARGLAEQALERKKYASALLVSAIVKAAKADDSIDLSAAFSDDRKRNNRLFDQLRLATGLYAYQDVKDAKGKTKNVFVPVPGMRKYLPMPGSTEDKASEAFKRKASLRSAMATRIKEAAQASCKLVLDGYDVKFDNDTKVLAISGGTIAKDFGTEPNKPLLLDGHTVGNDDNGKKASLTTVRELAGERVGATGRRTQADRSAKEAKQAAVDTNAFGRMVNTMIEAINKKEGTFADDEIKQLRSLRSAIDTALNKR